MATMPISGRVEGENECQNWEHEHLLQINDDANFDKKGGTTNSGRAAAQASLAYNNDGSTRYYRESAWVSNAA